MTAKLLRRRQNAVPFVPYKILLVDGRDLLINHPDFVSVSDEEESITLFSEASGVEIVDVALIISLQYREPDEAV